MKVPEFLNSCCCTLVWSAKIIGCFELIVYVVQIVLFSVALVLVGQNFYPGISALYGLYVVNLILKCVGLVVIALLLYGIHTRQFLILRPWMVLAIFEVLMIVISVIINSVCLGSTMIPLYGFVLFFIIFDGLWIVFKFIFFLVIYKYHKTLMEMELERLNKLASNAQAQQQPTNLVSQQQTLQVPNQQSNPIPYQPTQQIPQQQPNQQPYQQTPQIPYQHSNKMQQQETYEQSVDLHRGPMNQTPETSYVETSETPQKKDNKLNIDEPAIIYTSSSVSSNYH